MAFNFRNQTKKGMGPQTMHKRNKNLSTNYDYGRFSSFPQHISFCGSFFKIDIHRRPFNQKPLVFRKNPRTHLEVQGSFGDEGTFQECQKSSIFKKPTIRWDRKLETRALFRRRISLRSILSRQNPLNRDMEQNMLFWPENKFFQLFGFSAL